MIPEFILVVANFIYNMYVCGKTGMFGCSADIVEKSEVVKLENGGKILLFTNTVVGKFHQMCMCFFCVFSFHKFFCM